MIGTQCAKCKHLRGIRRCDAFDMIPADILVGEYDHSQRHPQQTNDVVYEPEVQDEG